MRYWEGSAGRLAVLVSMVVVLWSTSALAQEAGDSPMEGLTGGSAAWEVAFDEAMLQGRRAYNAEDFVGARRAFVRAAQVLPGEAVPYRNLARTLFWQEDFSRATAYYDVYLELVPQASDRAGIEQERRAAAARAGAEVATADGPQEMAMRSLRRELEEGRGYTPGGGGAWGLYKTLLRMEYADPELATLRSVLQQKIVGEFEGLLEFSEGFVPLLRRDDWALQADRLEALEEVARRQTDLEWVDRRRLLVNTATDLLGGRYGRAAEIAIEAAIQNGDLPFVGWYRVVALWQARRPDDALQALDNLLEYRNVDAPAVQVFRGQILQEVGHTEEAAAIYRGVLTEGGGGNSQGR